MIKRVIKFWYFILLEINGGKFCIYWYLKGVDFNVVLLMKILWCNFCKDVGNSLFFFFLKCCLYFYICYEE